MKFLEQNTFTLELTKQEIDIIVDLLANVQLGHKEYQETVKDMLVTLSNQGLNNFEDNRSIVIKYYSDDPTDFGILLNKD